MRHEHPGLEKAIDREFKGFLRAALFLGSTQLLPKNPAHPAEVSLPGMAGLVLESFWDSGFKDDETSL